MSDIRMTNQTEPDGYVPGFYISGRHQDMALIQDIRQFIDNVLVSVVRAHVPLKTRLKLCHLGKFLTKTDAEAKCGKGAWGYYAGLHFLCTVPDLTEADVEKIINTILEKPRSTADKFFRQVFLRHPDIKEQFKLNIYLFLKFGQMPKTVGIIVQDEKLAITKHDAKSMPIEKNLDIDFICKTADKTRAIVEQKDNELIKRFYPKPGGNSELPPWKTMNKRAVRKKAHKQMLKDISDFFDAVLRNIPNEAYALMNTACSVKEIPARQQQIDELIDEAKKRACDNSRPINRFFADTFSDWTDMNNATFNTMLMYLINGEITNEEAVLTYVYRMDLSKDPEFAKYNELYKKKAFKKEKVGVHGKRNNLFEKFFPGKARGIDQKCLPASKTEAPRAKPKIAEPPKVKIKVRRWWWPF